MEQANSNHEHGYCALFNMVFFVAGVVFYLKDGTACDTLSKLKKRLSQDGKFVPQQ